MTAITPAFERMGEENAFAVLARAAELQRQGRDIINLGIGQPDFKTPPHIVEAAVKARATASTAIPTRPEFSRCARRWRRMCTAASGSKFRRIWSSSCREAR